MTYKDIVSSAFKKALPIVAGYIVLGIPCGILCSQAGMDVIQVLFMSLLFYSGAGQYMIPNMLLSGTPILSIVTSVSLVNTRQVLYGASLSRFLGKASKRLSFLFAATVTDESFGINLSEFEKGSWSTTQATLVNLFSLSSWTFANVVGVIMGGLLTIPTALASFAMTSIFICLLFSQKATTSNIIAGAAAFIGVFLCKGFGLSGPAILVGALVGIVLAFVHSEVAKRS